MVASFPGLPPSLLVGGPGNEARDMEPELAGPELELADCLS